MENWREQIYDESLERNTINLYNDCIKDRTYSLIKNPEKKCGYLSVPQNLVNLYDEETQFKLTVQENGALLFTPTKEFYIK